jgi:hypothetical protein
MKPSAVFNDAFLVCHEIYQAARELVNSRVPTTQLTSASKFLWRPDLRPRLVEYVADFARAGERALGAGPTGSGGNGMAPTRGAWESGGRAVKEVSRDGHGLFASDNTGTAGQRRSHHTPRASRLILFRMYYLGGAEYEAARHLLGLSERTWSDWAEEIRQRVGAELIRARMYPPARYFREASPASTSGASTPSTNGCSQF